MADSNMDFENNANLMEEDPPPILSCGIREVFHQLASMLDIKSYMKLAMASKTMYNRCMEDQMIRIELEEKEVSVRAENGVRSFSFHSFDIAENHMEKYLEKLRQLKCSVVLKKIHFHGRDADVNNILETRRYLDELGVKTIESMRICYEFVVLQPVSFIKDYNLKNVEIGCELPDDVIRSLLQLNLDSLNYQGSSIEGEMLLQVDSPIPLLKLSMQPSADVLTQILWKIQTGALQKLAIDYRNIPWDSFTEVYYFDDGPLPDERPLLVSNGYRKKWFLHWDGAVTKCFGEYSCDFSKCEKDDLPPVLLSKEIVHKALAERHDKVSCLKSHFTSFFDGIPVLKASHKGPFPEERPLLCKREESNFLACYLLKGDGSMDSYFYEGHAEFGATYDMEENWPDIEDHPPLQKYIIKKRIEKCVKGGRFTCRNLTEFRSIFDDFKTLPYDFRDELPERRPLVFKNTLLTTDWEIAREHRIVLYEDGSPVLYNCSARCYDVSIQPCPAWYLPEAMLSSENVKKIILEAPFKMFTYSIDYDMFCDAFEGIKTISLHAFDQLLTFGQLPGDIPLVFTSVRLEDDEIFDHRWLLLEDGNVRKCEWKDGEATFSRASTLEFPFILTKTLVTAFFEGREVYTDLGFLIERDVLSQCLEDCWLVPYDEHKTSLFSDSRPLIFEKTQVKHNCEEEKKNGCNCEDEILHLCFVNDNEDVIHITWDDRYLSFNENPEPEDLPSILKTKEYLEYLLQAPWNSGELKKKWYGSSEDFVSYFESHKMADLNHEGRLPMSRPLVFKEKNTIETSVYWFLRKDGVLIMCEKKDSHALLTANPENDRPPAISRSP